MEESDSEYGGSFIDDGEDEEEGYDLESTGSLRDGEEEDNAVASAAEDLNGEDSEVQEVNPPLNEMRQRRQLAFGNDQM